MSWRQPAIRTIAAIAHMPIPCRMYTRAFRRPSGYKAGFLGLILHLHDRYRMHRLEIRPRLCKGELGIARLEAEEELVRRRPSTEVGRVEKRVIGRGQAAHRKHPESRRQAGPENRPLVSRHHESGPGVIG